MALISIRRRRDTKANWELHNPILDDGQLGFELNITGSYDKFKIGDGVTPWNSLKYSYDWEAVKAQADIAISKATNAQTSATNAANSATSSANAATTAVTNIVGTEILETISQTIKGAINEVSSELDNLTTDLDAHKLDYTEHLNSTMPHKIENLKTGKTYRYGYQISAEGIPQVISEEVI